MKRGKKKSTEEVEKVEEEKKDLPNDGPFNVLVLDPALSTGYVVMKVDPLESKADIFVCGSITLDSQKEYEGDQCLELMKQIGELMDKHCVKKVGFESYFFSKRFAMGSTLNVALRTAIEIETRRRGLEYDILNISQWKSFVAGRSTPTKEQVRAWGKEPAKKLFIQQALWDNFGFRFPNHSISPKTGRPVSFCLDIIDATAQAVYFAGCKMRIRDIVMTVKFPPDVVFKKPPKKVFVYPEEKGEGEKEREEEKPKKKVPTKASTKVSKKTSPGELEMISKSAEKFKSEGRLKEKSMTTMKDLLEHDKEN